jgi:hypothetical protein
MRARNSLFLIIFKYLNSENFNKSLLNLTNGLTSFLKKFFLLNFKKSSLKGHGNEADFLGFLQKLVPHESLTLPFEPFRFWLRIRGDIHIRKTTPRYHRYGESPVYKYKYK